MIISALSFRFMDEGLLRAKTEFAEHLVTANFDPAAFLADAGSDVSVDGHLNDIHAALVKMQALRKPDRPFDAEYDALVAYRVLTVYRAEVAKVLQGDRDHEAALASADGPSDDWRESLNLGDTGGVILDTGRDDSVDRQITRDAGRADADVSESLRRGMQEQRGERDARRGETIKLHPSGIYLPLKPKTFGQIASAKMRYEGAVQYAAQLVVAAASGNPPEKAPRLAPLINPLRVATAAQINKLCRDIIKISRALKYPEDTDGGTM